MDITPHVAAGTLLITAYGKDGFKVNGRLVATPALITPEKCFENADLSVATLPRHQDKLAGVELLLVGAGTTVPFIKESERLALKQALGGIVVEWMDSAAAARTYSVLVTEGRRVGVLLST